MTFPLEAADAASVPQLHLRPAGLGPTLPDPHQHYRLLQPGVAGADRAGLSMSSERPARFRDDLGARRRLPGMPVSDNRPELVLTTMFA